MAELIEKIPLDRLTLLNKMTVDDYIKLANKKNTKKMKLKTTLNKLNPILKTILNVMVKCKKCINIARVLKMGGCMVSVLFKTCLQAFVVSCLAGQQPILI